MYCTLQTRYQCAVEHGVTVVTPDWILDCDSHGTRLSESSYHPSLLELEEEAASAEPNETLDGPNSVREYEEKDGVIVAGNEMTKPFQNKTEEKEICFPSTSTEETPVESNNLLEMKLQAWNEDSVSSILEGIVFHIVDYPHCVGEETIDKWKKVNDIFHKMMSYYIITLQVIYSNAGTVIDHYDASRCTHLLAQRTSSEMCTKVCDFFMKFVVLKIFIIGCVCVLDRLWLTENVLAQRIG